MAAPKTLLLTATTPHQRGVGGIFLSDLCRYYPHHRLCCFALEAPRESYAERGINWLPTRTAAHPFGEGARWETGRLGRLTTAARFHWARRTAVGARARDAIEYAREQGVERIWAILDRPFMYRVVEQVVTALDLPLYTTVWDPPEGMALNMRLDPLSRRTALDDFARVVRRAAACSVMSAAMQEQYSADFGVRCVILRHGVSRGLWQPVATQLSDPKRLTIGFAGSLYGAAEWKVMLRALDARGWCLRRRQIVLRTLGTSIDVGTARPCQIEHLGWRPVPDVIQRLAETDVCYLPLFSEPEREVHARLAFPSKLTTYLASGRPILHHGPPTSSVTGFLRQYPAGTCCHSHEPHDVLESLRRFIDDPEFYRRAAAAGRIALEVELSLRVFRQRFAEFLDIPQRLLQPLDPAEEIATRAPAQNAPLVAARP